MSGDLLSITVHGLLVVGGLSCGGAWVLGVPGQLVAAGGFSSYGTQA